MSDRAYYINTKENVTFLFEVRESYKIPPESILLLGIRRCNKWEFLLFKFFGINLKANKADRYKWLKARFKKWLKK